MPTDTSPTARAPGVTDAIERLRGQLKVSDAYAAEANKDKLASVWQLQNAHLQFILRDLERALAHPPAAEREAPDFDLEATQSEAHGEGMDHAADFIFTELAKALGLASFTPQDGSEEWKGDVQATLMHILYDARVIDPETGEREAPGGVVPEWSAEACELIERLAVRVERDQLTVVHETWFYDDSCNAWEPPNDTAEAWDSEMTDLAAAIRNLAAAPSPPAARQCGGDGARERALREAATIAARMEIAWAQSGQQFNEAGMIPAGDARRSYAYAAREVQREILALLAAPAEGDGNGEG